MTRRDEKTPAVPLGYEPSRQRRPRWLAIVFASLVAAVLLALLALVIDRERTVRQVLVQARLQAALAAQAAATQQATTAPVDEYFVTLEQRRSARLGDGRLIVSIGDITGGQVLLRITDDAGNDLMAKTPVSEGDVLEFADKQGAPLRVEILKLTNNLVGDDSAEMTIRPAEPAPATQPALSEAEKVEALLDRILATRDAIFIRNGSEHSAADAVDHLRMKWRQAGGAENPDATAEDFIEKIASRSSLSGREYRIRLPDGREVPSGQWLREQLREIEAERQRPATRPETEPAESDETSEAQLISYDAAPDEATMTQPINLPLPTLGGKQLWTDLRISADGWRIQRHALTGHCRLLDDRDRRQAWGTEAVCRSAWERLHADPPAEQRAGRELVVLLHGLGRTRSAMRPMGDFLRDSGFDVVEFGYASTRGRLDEHAEALAGVLAELKGYERVHFVGHSLGALVVRRHLARSAAADALPAGRVVMLAPPNAGSSLAARLGRNPLYLVALGPVGQEIAEWKSLEATLATPEDFAVIAGDCESWSNPLLDSAGDLVVTVEETKLDGMREFRCVDATHTFMMRNSEVMRMTLSFLRNGRLQ